jgi:hypothetical protein
LLWTVAAVVDLSIMAPVEAEFAVAACETVPAIQDSGKEIKSKARCKDIKFPYFRLVRTREVASATAAKNGAPAPDIKCQ